jgi:hypothetical protein
MRVEWPRVLLTLSHAAAMSVVLSARVHAATFDGRRGGYLLAAFASLYTTCQAINCRFALLVG